MCTAWECTSRVFGACVAVTLVHLVSMDMGVSIVACVGVNSAWSGHVGATRRPTVCLSTTVKLDWRWYSRSDALYIVQVTSVRLNPTDPLVDHNRNSVVCVTNGSLRG